MLRLADGAIAEYERLKRQRGVLDFEDLVVRTVMLLARARRVALGPLQARSAASIISSSTRRRTPARASGR